MRSAAASTSKKAHSAHTILFESITAMPHQQTARGPGTFASTPCPSIQLNLCTYLISGLVGPIRFIFWEVKIGTGRFVIKYDTIGYMLLWGVIGWVEL